MSNLSIILLLPPNVNETDASIIDFTLDRLAELKHKEIILIHNGYYKPQHKIIEIKYEQFNFSKLLNEGAIKAKGSILWFHDYDVYLPFWQVPLPDLTNIIISKPFNTFIDLDQKQTEELIKNRKLNLKTNESKQPITFASFAIRKTAFEQIRGFDEALTSPSLAIKELDERINKSYIFRKHAYPKHQINAVRLWSLNKYNIQSEKNEENLYHTMSDEIVKNIYIRINNVNSPFKKKINIYVSSKPLRIAHCVSSNIEAYDKIRARKNVTLISLELHPNCINLNSIQPKSAIKFADPSDYILYTKTNTIPYPDLYDIILNQESECLALYANTPKKEATNFLGGIAIKQSLASKFNDWKEVENYAIQKSEKLRNILIADHAEKDDIVINSNADMAIIIPYDLTTSIEQTSEALLKLQLQATSMKVFFVEAIKDKSNFSFLKSYLNFADHIQIHLKEKNIGITQKNCLFNIGAKKANQFKYFVFLDPTTWCNDCDWLHNVKNILKQNTDQIIQPYTQAISEDIQSSYASCVTGKNTFLSPINSGLCLAMHSKTYRNRNGFNPFHTNFNEFLEETPIENIVCTDNTLYYTKNIETKIASISNDELLEVYHDE